ncbi:MAG: endonuclease [Omnitrophica bacterium RIFCSPLOWO2_01_FULL_45_10]|nr:MAG: endonuclease [Omnitrophica bacterium RIFCSPLOWO2_01_FULL_45_10]
MENQKALITIYDKLYEFFGPQGWWPGRTRLEIIVGAILTQNTAWSNVEKAIVNLKLERVLSTPSAIKKMSVNRLATLIRPSGYYNVKAKRLRHFTDFLFSKYGGSLNELSMSDTGVLRRELLNVNGIGPETCDSILLYAFKRPIFVVDAYTKRLFSRHKFFDERLNYHDAQKFFMSRLPNDEKLFNEYHALIVRVGKTFCKRRPNCRTCPLYAPKK